MTQLVTGTHRARGRFSGLFVLSCVLVLVHVYYPLIMSPSGLWGILRPADPVASPQPRGIEPGGGEKPLTGRPGHVHRLSEEW